MGKKKAAALLSLVGVLLAALLVLTFVRFPVGVSYYNSFVGAIDTDYGVSNGVAYEYKLSGDNVEEIEDIDGVIKTFQTRLDKLGYQEYSVKALKGVDENDKEYSIRVEVRPALNDYGEFNYTDVEEDLATVGQYGYLRFFGDTSKSPDESKEILTDVDVIKSAVYDGYTTSGGTTYYLIKITFTDAAYNSLVKAMGDASYYLKITLGDETLSPFDGSSNSALSSSNFSKEMTLTSTNEASAKRMALQISSGGLDYKFDSPEYVGVTSVAYSDGALIYCYIAILVAVLFALILMCRGGFGLIAVLSTLLYVCVYAFLLIAIPGIRVSVGGFVGVAFAFALLCDGFVIIMKRIYEEYGKGKTVKASVGTGFKRSFMPIVNSSVCSVIVALLLYLFTKGAVRSFAITFGIGAALSFVTTVLFTRMFSSLILPLAKNKERFLNLKREGE